MTDRKAKQEQFKPTSSKRIPLIIASLCLALVLGAAGFYLAAPMAAADGQKVSAVNGQILLPVGEVSDGQAHFYRFQGKEGEIRFFVLKSDDGVIRAAFNACDVCYRDLKGYTQDGAEMVCNACGQRFAANRINEVKGGCNPAPLERVVEGDKLVITVADLEAGAWYFAGKKS